MIRNAIGYSCLVAAVLVAAGWGADATSDICVIPEVGSYLAGVWERTLQSPYQILLAAGLVGVVLHFVHFRVFHKDQTETAAYIRFASWAQTLFTSLGFLGTIIGVSLAVGGLESAMSDDDPAAMICGLSTAFDTTFLGLSTAVVLMIQRRFAGPGDDLKHG